MKNTLRKIFTLLTAIVLLSATLLQFAGADTQNTVSVKGYLVAPSQYTNMENFGVHIEKTINGQSSIVSLGNFGGYVVYEFDRPVYNSDTHSCGIDFIVSGNAFAATASAQEPGQVWVSADGEKWYALAGSEHYEDETIWNYTVTYSKNPEVEAKCLFTDSLGDSGDVSTATASRYPDGSVYTLAEIPEDHLSLSGVLLRKQRTPSTDNVIVTKFGYVDTLLNSNSSAPVNPYSENFAKDCRDGQFDISWAVDENGMPVNLECIKFVKVQTAMFVNSGAFGEKSTEISSIVLADETESVGKTNAPSSVKIGKTSLDLSSGENVFSASVSKKGFTVSVNSDANVYINNEFGNTRTFDTLPEKGIVRIIVQEGTAEPVIYYVNLTGTDSEAETVTETEIITPPETEETTTVTDEENPSGEKCDHLCHKGGVFGVVWKIIRFFIKLFGTNKYCECGMAHY